MPTTATREPGGRVVSLDVFRGLAIAAMILVTDPGTYSARYAPLCHSDWTGPTATDMISPAFLLIVGMAIPFSFASRKNRGVSNGQTLLHIFRRASLLILVGLFLNGFPDFQLQTLRTPGILQHIAVCYVVAALLHLGFQRGLAGRAPRRNLLLGAAAIALLVVYAALLRYFPVPGFGPGRLDSLGSLPAYVDRQVFGVPHLWLYGTTPGYGVTFDPDGLMSSLSGIAVVLMGVLTGEWLRSSHTAPRKAGALAFAGVSMALVGYALGPSMPLIKKLWTPTFALFSAGLALLVFVLLYILVDLLKQRAWAVPFRIFGANAIFAFALSTIITTLGDRLHLAATGGATLTLHKWAYIRLFAIWLAPIDASLAYALAIVLLNLALVYPLYRKRLFINL